jgi:hypothetical protein
MHKIFAFLSILVSGLKYLYSCNYIGCLVISKELSRQGVLPQTMDKSKNLVILSVFFCHQKSLESTTYVVKSSLLCLPEPSFNIKLSLINKNYLMKMKEGKIGIFNTLLLFRLILSPYL